MAKVFLTALVLGAAFIYISFLTAISAFAAVSAVTNRQPIITWLDSQYSVADKLNGALKKNIGLIEKTLPKPAQGGNSLQLDTVIEQIFHDQGEYSTRRFSVLFVGKTAIDLHHSLASWVQQEALAASMSHYSALMWDCGKENDSTDSRCLVVVLFRRSLQITKVEIQNNRLEMRGQFNNTAQKKKKFSVIDIVGLTLYWQGSSGKVIRQTANKKTVKKKQGVAFNIQKRHFTLSLPVKKIGCSTAISATQDALLQLVVLTPQGPEVAATFSRRDLLRMFRRRHSGLSKAFKKGCVPKKTKDLGTVTSKGRGLSFLYAQIHSLRQNHGIRALNISADIEAVAKAYARLMADEGFIAHVSPLGSTLQQRLSQAGLRFLGASENLYVGTYAESAIEAWWASLSHRQNLLRKTSTHMGMGMASDNTGKSYVVAVFSRFLEESQPRLSPAASLCTVVSESRLRQGHPLLPCKELLSRWALRHSRWMLAEGRLSFVQRGGETLAMAIEQDDAWSHVAVEIFKGPFPDVARLSKHHQGGWQAMGVGVVQDDKGVYWCTLVFARR